MKPTMEILARISQDSSKNKEEVFTRLYRYLLRPDIYHEAYRNLYANSGAATKGVNEDTADGFSEAKSTVSSNRWKQKPINPSRPAAPISKKPTGKCVRWGFPPLRTSWYRRCFGWCCKLCMSRFSKLLTRISAKPELPYRISTGQTGVLRCKVVYRGRHQGLL